MCSDVCPVGEERVETLLWQSLNQDAPSLQSLFVWGPFSRPSNVLYDMSNWFNLVTSWLPFPFSENVALHTQALLQWF